MTEHSIQAAVIGTDVGGSFSPNLHNTWAAEAGIDGEWQYGRAQLSDVPEGSDEERQANFDAHLEQLEADGVTGASVTMPYKIMALRSGLVEEVSPAARAIGAANTLVHRGSEGGWLADNTDYIGALNSITDVATLTDKSRALVLGTGGAARAVAFGFGVAGVKAVTISGRNMRAAAQIANELNIVFEKETVFKGVELKSLIDNETSRLILSSAGVIYNATSVGELSSKAQIRTPLPAHVFTGNLIGRSTIIADAVYKPLETELLRLARVSPGRITIDGISMLTHQARRQFELFTGQPDPSYETGRQAILAALS